MLFCWLEPSKRTKVDEVHSLLQNISQSSSAQAAAPGALFPDATMEAFEQKWEHLMPNKRQRHASGDSLEDQLGSGSARLGPLICSRG